MAYKDTFGITKIINDKMNNLQINIEEMDEFVAMLLFTPDMDDKNEHYHIELTKENAKPLRDWLNEFLEDDIEKKYNNDLKK